jgi:mitochondrial fission protein ELM1
VLLRTSIIEISAEKILSGLPAVPWSTAKLLSALLQSRPCIHKDQRPTLKTMRGRRTAPAAFAQSRQSLFIRFLVLFFNSKLLEHLSLDHVILHLYLSDSWHLYLAKIAEFASEL